MIAWVLIYGIGYNYAYAVPNIASKAECERLYKEIAGDKWTSPPFKCVEYRIAR